MSLERMREDEGGETERARKKRESEKGARVTFPLFFRKTKTKTETETEKKISLSPSLLLLTVNSHLQSDDGRRAPPVDQALVQHVPRRPLRPAARVQHRADLPRAQRAEDRRLVGRQQRGEGRDRLARVEGREEAEGAHREGQDRGQRGAVDVEEGGEGEDGAVSPEGDAKVGVVVVVAAAVKAVADVVGGVVVKGRGGGGRGGPRGGREAPRAAARGQGRAPAGAAPRAAARASRRPQRASRRGRGGIGSRRRRRCQGRPFLLLHSSPPSRLVAAAVAAAGLVSVPSAPASSSLLLLLLLARGRGAPGVERQQIRERRQALRGGCGLRRELRRQGGREGGAPLDDGPLCKDPEPARLQEIGHLPRLVRRPRVPLLHHQEGRRGSARGPGEEGAALEVGGAGDGLVCPKLFFFLRWVSFAEDVGVVNGPPSSFFFLSLSLSVSSDYYSPRSPRARAPTARLPAAARSEAERCR